MRHDRIMNADLRNVAHASFAVIDAVQDYEAEEALLAISVVFRAACERYEFSPSDLLATANNIIHNGETKRPEFRATLAFMEREWHA